MAKIESTVQVRASPPYDQSDYWVVETSLDTDTGLIVTTVKDSAGSVKGTGEPSNIQSRLGRITGANAPTLSLINNTSYTVGLEAEAAKAKYQDLVPNANNGENVDGKPMVDETISTDQQNKNFISSGGSDDDKGQINSTPITNSPQADQTNSTINNTVNTGAANAGTTIAGKSDTKNTTNLENKPIPRPNPLGSLSSYNYQVSLYMVTPDAYNDFQNSGGTSIKTALPLNSGNLNSAQGGAFLIMQSGGINSSSTPRAPGFELDYYIDSLRIESLVNPKETGTASMATKISFQVTEPYGFSLLSKLKEAASKLETYSKIKNLDKMVNATRQFFILGVRFLGYDEKGNLITGKTKLGDREVNPNGDSIFEVFYDILISKITFKIDGKATVYNISAVSSGTKMQQVLESRIKCKVPIQATTVGEALNQFVNVLNADELNRKGKDVEIPNKYSIVFQGDGSKFIENASLATPDDMTKWNWGWSKAKNTSAVNDATAVKAVPNSNTKGMMFAENSAIQMAFERIISQSTYLKDALDIVYYNTVEGVDPIAKERFMKTTEKPMTLRWYNLSMVSNIIGYDTLRKTFAYDVRYVISPYETPVYLSPYPKTAPDYYGPYKRYDYWYTGKNSEIINYEQQVDNGFFTVVLNPDGSSKSGGGSGDIPSKATKQDSNSDGALNATSKQAQGSYHTDLYDPKSFANVKITILGDPDFLVNDIVTPYEYERIKNKFYRPNGYTINPNAGQVFIEINFKEGVDYNNGTGLLDINSSISFWQYPESIKKIVNGVSYQITKAVHNFKSGQFTQELYGFINTFGSTTDKWATDENSQQREDAAELLRESRRGTGNAPTSTSSASVPVSTGLLPSPPLTSPTVTNALTATDTQLDQIDGTIANVRPEGREG